MLGCEQENFASFLFDRDDIEVLDIKFLPGKDPNLSAERICAAAKSVLINFFDSPTSSQLPAGRREQRSVAEIFAIR